MFLDDLREPTKKYGVIVRPFEEATKVMSKKGVSSYISFDHDLGFKAEDKIEKMVIM